jgi:serine/threonine protein phosphatase PrpC
MKFVINSASHRGLVRKNNEDFQLSDSSLGLVVVCDGVGGHASGEVASRMTATRIQQHLLERADKVRTLQRENSKQSRIALCRMVEEAIQVASLEVFERSESESEHHGMATTVEVLLLSSGHAILGHVGDSRTYLLRSGKPLCLTEDHTVAAEMLRSGLWTQEVAENSPYSSTLTRAVGQQRYIIVDTLEVEVSAGDTFLLCTDGLSNYFSTGLEFAEAAKKAPVEKLSEELVQLALSRGGGDNVTAAVVRIEQVGRPAELDERTEPDLSRLVDAGQKTEILSKLSLFQFFTPRELTRLMAIAVQESIPAGTAVMRQGEPGSRMLVLLSGSVRIIRNDQVLGVRTRGSLIGEMAILDHSPRSASVVSQDPIQVLWLEQKELFELLRTDSQMAVKFLWALSQSMNRSLRDTSDQLAAVKTDLATPRSELPFSI